MGERGKAFRTTISVPQGLKARMDAVAESINWSALACRAWELKLGEIAAKKASKSMEDVIQRLRASKQRSVDEFYREGEKAGREWAEQHAEADELENLQECRAMTQDWEADFEFDFDGRGGWHPSQWLYFAMFPELDGNREEAATFWEHILGHDQFPKPSFVRGFAEGALGLWEEVKDKL